MFSITCLLHSSTLTGLSWWGNWTCIIGREVKQIWWFLTGTVNFIIKLWMIWHGCWTISVFSFLSAPLPVKKSQSFHHLSCLCLLQAGWNLPLTHTSTVNIVSLDSTLSVHLWCWCLTPSRDLLIMGLFACNLLWFKESFSRVEMQSVQVISM